MIELRNVYGSLYAVVSGHKVNLPGNVRTPLAIESALRARAARFEREASDAARLARELNEAAESVRLAARPRD